jgi:hypothetical protein
MKFKDTEILDGLLSENLMELEPQGYLVTPPDVFSNNLKIFVQRSALQRLDVLGVIANGARRGIGGPDRMRRKPLSPSRQMRLFSS